MKEIVFDEKTTEFFNCEKEKALDDIAVTMIHKDTLEQKDKEIERLKNKVKEINEEMNYQINLKTKNANEINRLNKKYNKALELLADYNMPCEYDEGKIPDDYCEENCDDDYKKCWAKYIELELKGSDKE